MPVCDVHLDSTGHTVLTWAVSCEHKMCI